MTKRNSIVALVVIALVAGGLYVVASGLEFDFFRSSAQLPSADTVANRLAALEEQRRTAWATTFDGWDFIYSGKDTCADNVPNHLRCDNPIDDDWSDPRVVASSFVQNYQPVGFERNDFLLVDRVSNPLDWGKTGNIWRRDEALSFAEGYTMELSLRVDPSTDTDSIFIAGLDDKSSFAVLLSPGRIKISPTTGVAKHTDPDDPGVEFVTSDTFHTYRIVKWPGSFKVSVYVDGSQVPIREEDADAGFHVGSVSNIMFPYVLFGDNSNERDSRAHYVLDYFAYRRGAFPPGVALSALPIRTPPPLPMPASMGEEFYYGFDGTFLPTVGGTYSVQGSLGGWKQLDGGIVEFINSPATRPGVTIDDVPSLINKNGYTVEARVKVEVDSQDQGFSLTMLDEMGSATLTWSTNRLEAVLGLKKAGILAVPMDTTNDFHTYRLVRPANSLYVYVYVDNDPVPVIVDYHLDGSTEVHGFPVKPFMNFGYTGHPGVGVDGHVLIDYIRWHDGASAPPLSVEPGVSLLCSNDRGVTFISGPCNDTVAIVQWPLVEHATSCTASSDESSRWNGAKPVSGTETVEALVSARTYTLTCEGPRGTATASVVVGPQIAPIISIPGDIDGDGDVDIFDYTTLVAHFAR